MNPHDQTEDAEFEAFLKGEGDLASQLRQVPQAQPPESLTAAILAQAEVQAQAQAKAPVQVTVAGQQGAPANDTVHDALPAAPPSRHYLRRARVPLGLAASVVVALFVARGLMPQAVTQEAAQETVRQVAQEVAKEAAQAPKQASVQAPVAATNEASAPGARARVPVMIIAEAVPAMPEAKIALSAPPPLPVLPAVSASAHQPAAAAAMAPAAPPVVESPVLATDISGELSSPKALAAPPAPVIEAAPGKPSLAAQRGMEADRIVAYARSTASVAAPAPPAPPAPAAAPPMMAPSPVSIVASRAQAIELPAVWMTRIGELLKAGKNQQALAEWNQFRQRYPDYEAPLELKQQVEALK
jgi:hypothetical protein